MAFLRLREAREDDMERLREWRNDPDTRIQSLDSREIDPETHREWFLNVMVDPERVIFILEADGLPAGMVRADRMSGGTRLSWLVAPSFRGKGYAAPMLRLAIALQHGVLFAEIKEGNAASIRVAEAVGMELHDRVGEVLLYSFTR